MTCIAVWLLRLESSEERRVFNDGANGEKGENKLLMLATLMTAMELVLLQMLSAVSGGCDEGSSADR